LIDCYTLKTYMFAMYTFIELKPFADVREKYLISNHGMVMLSLDPAVAEKYAGLPKGVENVLAYGLSTF